MESTKECKPNKTSRKTERGKIMNTLKEIKDHPEIAKNNEIARAFLKALKEKEERENAEKKAKENAEKFFNTKW